MKPNTVKIFILYYEQAFRTTLGWLHFKLKQSDRNLKLIENFLLRVEKQYSDPNVLGTEFFKSYLNFAFGSNVNRTVNGKKIIMITHILNKTIWKDFVDSNKNRKWGKKMHLIRHGAASKYGFAEWELKGSPAQLEKQQQETEIWSAVPAYEEKERKRFFNTMKGYLWCAQETTMFHPQSVHCHDCIRVQQCKTRQEVNYPTLAHLRNSLPSHND